MSSVIRSELIRRLHASAWEQNSCLTWLHSFSHCEEKGFGSYLSFLSTYEVFYMLCLVLYGNKVCVVWLGMTLVKLTEVKC